MTIGERTRHVLEELQNVHSDLLAISDDIWLSIDHNDPQALQSGVAFKQQYNEKMALFRQLEHDLGELLEHYLAQRNLPVAAQPLNGTEHAAEVERSSPMALDRRISHSLNEDFTHKRPYGYRLRSQSAVELNTWRAIYESVLLHLAQLHPQRFMALLDHPDMVSNRGNATVSRRPADLRRPHHILHGFYIETNYSANQFRDSLRRTLPILNFQPDELKIYLREDRDPEP